MSSETNRVEAVERALAILEAFKPDAPTLSLAAISERTGLYKSTILRLIGSLERFGYIARTSNGTYRLGPSVLGLAQVYGQSFNFESVIRPQLRHLVDVTGETAAFFMRMGNQRVCLYRENSHKPIRHHLDEGVLLPLERGATGRVLLAFSGETGEIYDTIRVEGFYVSRGERDPDVAAVAVPIFSKSGQLQGTLAVSALRSRLNDDNVAQALRYLRESADALRLAID